MRHALLFAAALALAIPASATPGRLNGKGCHNSKREGYHCHRAQSAVKAPLGTHNRSTKR